MFLPQANLFHNTGENVNSQMNFFFTSAKETFCQFFALVKKVKSYYIFLRDHLWNKMSCEVEKYTVHMFLYM